MRLSNQLVSLAFSLALFGAASSALAQPATPAAPSQDPVEEARAHYRRGRELYDENNFRAALVEMQRAYELSKNDKLLFDLGQIDYQLQDYPGALKAFTKYLASNKGDVPQDRLDSVQKDIERLKYRVATLRITVNKPGAQVAVDDAPVGASPLAEPVTVGIGHHKIVATADGQTSTPKELDVAGGDSVDVNLAFAETQATPVPTPGPKPQESHGVGAIVIVPWTITGLLAVATGVTGGVALGKSSQVSTDLKTGGITRAQLDSDVSSTKTVARVADVLLGTTIAAAGCSVVLTVVGLSGNDKPSGKTGGKAQTGALSVRVGVGSVGLSGSF